MSLQYTLKLSNIEHVQCCETKKNCANVIFFDGASYRPSASKSNFGGGGFFFVWRFTGSSNKIGKCIELFFFILMLGGFGMKKREKGSRWRKEKNLITFASFWNKEYK